MTTENKPGPFDILKAFAQQVGGVKATAALGMLNSVEGREIVTKVIKDAASTLGEAVEKIVDDAQYTALQARLKTLDEKRNRPKEP